MLSLKDSLLHLLAGLCLNACVSLETTASENAKLEPLYLFSAQQGKVEVGVKSLGCTKAEDFAAKMTWLSGKGALSIIRIKPDRCRRMPIIKRVVINVDLESLPFTLLTLENDIVISNLRYEKQ